MHNEINTLYVHKKKKQNISVITHQKNLFYPLGIITPWLGTTGIDE
jgi:hypothetical protein